MITKQNSWNKMFYRFGIKKLKILSLLLFWAIIFATPLKAQLFDAYFLAGLTMNQIDGDEAEGFSKLGTRAGVVLEYKINKYLYAQIGMLYVSKGSKTKTTDQQVVIGSFKTHLDYVELPLNLRFAATEQFSFLAGTSVSYLFRSNLLVDGYEVDPFTYSFHDFELAYKFGGQYFLNSNMAVEAIIQRSFSSIRKNKTWINYSLFFSLSYTLSKK